MPVYFWSVAVHIGNNNCMATTEAVCPKAEIFTFFFFTKQTKTTNPMSLLPTVLVSEMVVPAYLLSVPQLHTQNAAY